MDPEPVCKKKKPKIKGYSIYTSKSNNSSSESFLPNDYEFIGDTTIEELEDSTIVVDPISISETVGDWIAASLLPQYTDQISITSSMTVAESALDTFTTYKELREACLDSQFERVLDRLRAEWYYVGGSVRLGFKFNCSQSYRSFVFPAACCTCRVIRRPCFVLLRVSADALVI